MLDGSDIAMQRLAATLLLFAGPVLGQTYDHLEPDNSVFSLPEYSRDYYSNVAKVLGDVLPESAPKVIVLPSNQWEYIVGVDDEDESCRIVEGRSDQILWVYESDDPEFLERFSDYPENPLDARVTVYSQSSPLGICARIRQAWTSILLRTRYPEPDDVRIGVDGVSFHFSVWRRGMGLLTGKTWSPERQSVLGKLVALTYAMRDYARSESGDPMDALVAALVDLERALE